MFWKQGTFLDHLLKQFKETGSPKAKLLHYRWESWRILPAHVHTHTRPPFLSPLRVLTAVTERSQV